MLYAGTCRQQASQIIRLLSEDCMVALLYSTSPGLARERWVILSKILELKR
jgi:hypothetical protein